MEVAVAEGVAEPKAVAAAVAAPAAPAAAAWRVLPAATVTAGVEVVPSWLATSAVAASTPKAAVWKGEVEGIVTTASAATEVAMAADPLSRETT